MAADDADALALKREDVKRQLQEKVRDLDKEAFRAIVDRGDEGAKSEVGKDKAEEIIGLAQSFRVLSDQLANPATTEDMVKELFSESSSDSKKAGGDKKTGEEETPEEREAREAAEKRAAKKAATDRESLRALEQQRDQQNLAQQLAAAQQGGQGGKGKNSGGESGSGSQGSPQGFPPSSNSNDDDSQSQFGNGFDRLANRLSNLGNQGFGNFSSSQNSSKKDEDKKSSFSLPPSKSSSNDDFKVDSKPKASSNLPQLATSTQGSDLGGFKEFEGTPLSPAPMVPGSGSVGMNNSGMAGAGLNGNNSPLGGMLGGSSQASMGSFNQDFPFNITGETYDPEAEYDMGPRYRVYDISMTGSSSGGGDGVSGSSSGDLSDSSISNYKKIGVPQFLYFITPEEQSLKGVPGIFRSLAAGYRRTRIQTLCSLKDRKKIGLCDKVRFDLDG